MPHHRTGQRKQQKADDLKLSQDFQSPGSGPPPVPAAETDPVFRASEAAQFVPGDKAKLDNLQTLVENLPAGPPGPQGPPGPAAPETDPVFAASAAAQFVPGDKAKLDAALQPGGNVSALTNDAGYYVGDGAAFATAAQGAAADAAFHPVVLIHSQAEIEAQPFFLPATLPGGVNGGMPVTAAGVWGGLSLGTPNGSNANVCVLATEVTGTARLSVYGSCYFQVGFNPVFMFDIGGLKDASGDLFATQAWVGTQGYLTALTGHNVSELANDAGYLTDISARTAGAVASLSGHNVSELSNDAGYLTNLAGRNVSELGNDAGYLASLSGHNVSELGNDAGYSTGGYTPANASRWDGAPPATLAAAIDRLADVLSQNGATPIP